MNHWKLLKIVYNSRGSHISNNMGQNIHPIKYTKTLVNTYTGEIYETNDLKYKKNKRRKMIYEFTNVYSKPYLNKELSILTISVNQSSYMKIQKFLNTIIKKLKRKGIEKLGYIWVFDIGYKKFEKHYHLIMAVSRIEKTLFYELFNKKHNSNYEVEFMKTRYGMFRYLDKKDFFGVHKQKNFGRSRKFLSIKAS